VLVVGLTGGIGSGKTLVSNMFADLGIEIVDADIIARQVVQVGSHCLEKINERYGTAILLDDGNLNRAKLREKIFSDPSEKRWLEQLMHPEIHKVTQTALVNAKGDYAVYVSPLLIEANTLRLVDRVLIVDTEQEKQIARTTARDKVDALQVNAIIASQINQTERNKHADDIIYNSGSIESTTEQVQKLHLSYLHIAKNQD